MQALEKEVHRHMEEIRGHWRECSHWSRSEIDCGVLVRIQALEKEVQQTYLSGIGEDTMDSGDNPMMTKIYSGAS